MNTKNFSNSVDNKLEKYYNKGNTNSKRYFGYIHNDFSNNHYFKITKNTKRRKLYLLHNINKSHLINNEHDKIFRTVLSNKKDCSYPAIIPIVLYTGKNKWNTKESIILQQDNSLVNLKELSNFYLVDINKYEKQELLNNDILISKLMLIESAKTSEELIKYLKEIISKIKDEDKEFIANLINYILRNKIGNKKAKESIKELQGGRETMLACVEMLKEEERKNIRRGIKIGEKRGIEKSRKDKKEIAKKLLARNFSIEEIEEITGLTKQEIKNNV